MPLSEQAELALRNALWDTFQEFDEDKSGQVDTPEIEKMMKSLGMLPKPEDIETMMKEADTDKSGEIDFEEFFAAVKSKVEGAAGGSIFADLVNRKKNNGPALEWRSDKKGPGMVCDRATITKAKGEEGGAQLIQPHKSKGDDPWLWLRSGRGEECYDSCSVMLEFKKVPKGVPVYVGIVGSNYNPTPWTEELSKNSHCICMDGANGTFYSKGKENPNAKMTVLQSGYIVQLEINLKENLLGMTVSDAKNAIKATTQHKGLPPSVAVAVWLGKVAEGEEFEVELVGSSCEKIVETAMADAPKMSNEAAAAANDPMVKECQTQA